MSVGGRVVDVVPVDERKVWVNTDDARPPRLPNLCAVYVDPQGHIIRPGDCLWWQGGKAYWTPRSRPVSHTYGASDIELPKIGFSGVSRPAGAAQ